MTASIASPERGSSLSSNTEPPVADNAGHLSSKEENGLDRETSRSEQPEDDMEDDEVGHTATRMTSTVSIAEQLPLYREILFVTVICLAQLYTRESCWILL